jgi:Protein of unknown function (DUF3455)
MRLSLIAWIAGAAALSSFSPLIETSPKLTLTLPVNSLPTPTGKLKLVGLGRGKQNYTCAVPGSTAAPSPIGALAVLTNVGWFLQAHEDLVPSLPAIALCTGTANLRQPLGQPLGQHYFDKGNPTFDLSAANAKIVARKVASVPAPAHAGCNQSAVPWLELAALDSSYGGITEVYRVETAGGSPPATCERSTTAFEVPYAAEYWFFGP